MRTLKQEMVAYLVPASTYAVQVASVFGAAAIGGQLFGAWRISSLRLCLVVGVPALLIVILTALEGLIWHLDDRKITGRK